MAGLRTTLRYGDASSQFVEVWPARDRHVRGVAFVLHGGWWRARHDLHLMDGVCADLVTGGWWVANVEYRRIDGDGGGWPQTLTDVLAGVEAVTAAYPWLEGMPSVAIGHSAGGHLALLAGARGAVSAGVGLAPITDLARCVDEQLGEGAARSFVGADPARAAQRYRRSSPLHRLPLGCPQLIVHGDRDHRVPVEHSRDHVAASRAAGDRVEYVELADTDHFQVIETGHAAWSHVRAWLDRCVG